MLPVDLEFPFLFFFDPDLLLVFRFDFLIFFRPPLLGLHFARMFLPGQQFGHIFLYFPLQRVIPVWHFLQRFAICLVVSLHFSLVLLSCVLLDISSGLESVLLHSWWNGGFMQHFCLHLLIVFCFVRHFEHLLPRCNGDSGFLFIFSTGCITLWDEHFWLLLSISGFWIPFWQYSSEHKNKIKLYNQKIIKLDQILIA